MPVHGCQPVQAEVQGQHLGQRITMRSEMQGRTPYYLRPSPRLLRLPKVMELTGLSKPTIYRMIEAGDFPRQWRLSPRTVGWLEQEVLDWITGRPCSMPANSMPCLIQTVNQRSTESPENNKGHPKAA